MCIFTTKEASNVLCFTNILDIITKGVTILGTVFTASQLYLLAKQIKTNHEATRRRTTIDVMTTWCNAMQPDTSLAVKAAVNLSEKQCSDLYHNKPFEVTKEIKTDICKFCVNYNKCYSDQTALDLKCSLTNGCIVDGQILSSLRWHVVTYLNALETVMTSWHMGTVDKEVIEEQFLFLLSNGKGRALANFRNAAGGYPYIEEFLDKIKSKPKTNQKEPL